MEGTSVEFLIDNFPSLNKFRPHKNFLDQLQYLHDSSPVKEWKTGLKKIARYYKLNIDVLNKVR